MPETDWLEPLDDAPTSRRPGPLLLGLASLPWLLVVALLLVPGRGGADPALDPAATDTAPMSSAPPSSLPQGGSETTEAPAAVGDATDSESGTVPEGVAIPPPHVPGDAADPTADPTTDPTADPAPDTGVDALDLVETRGRWRVEPGVEEAVGLAVVAARGWLTGVEPVLELAGLDPPERTYAEHLVVEAVEQPAGDAVVVTLLAIVLTPDEPGRVTPEVRRLAVPVALTATGPRIAGAPWDLPPPDLEPIVLPRRPVGAAGEDEPRELQAARDALVDAGLGDRELVALHRTSGWPVIAETTLAGASGSHEVWLRRHLDGFVVSGTTLAGDVHARAPASPGPDVDPESAPDAGPDIEPEPQSQTPSDTPRGDAP